MPINPYLVGEVVRLDLALTDLSAVAVDPAALRLKVKAPDSTVTAYVYGVAADLVKDSPGNYHFNLPLASAGAYFWRWETDAPNAGAAEGGLVVQPSRVI